MGTTTADAVNSIASTTGQFFTDSYGIFILILGFFVIALVFSLIIKAIHTVMRNL
jgi:hypothetical protein